MEIHTYIRRPLRPADVAAIRGIEKDAPGESPEPYPWAVADIVARFGVQGTRDQVIEWEGQVVAYILTEENREPRSGLTTCRIVRIAVREDHRRQGLASHLLDDAHRAESVALTVPSGTDPAKRYRPSFGELGFTAVESRSQSRALGLLHAEIPEGNVAAQCLFRKAGYRATEIVRDCTGTRTDVYYRMVRGVYPAVTAAG